MSSEGSTVLALCDVHKHFGALRAVDGVSLEVKQHQIYALIGPNGAGKSTLVDVIYGAGRVDRGKIMLHGTPIEHLSIPSRVRLGIGRSFQISNLLPNFTVLQNAIIAEQSRLGQEFRFFLPAFSDSELQTGAKEILARVGIEHIADRRVADISHGERRLLELALAVSLRPKLLVLDEPMAGTSPAESKGMTTVIAALAKEMSVLLIEHDMDAVFALADRLSVLVEGRVIAEGSVAEIQADQQVRLAYLGDSA